MAKSKLEILETYLKEHLANNDKECDELIDILDNQDLVLCNKDAAIGLLMNSLMGLANTLKSKMFIFEDKTLLFNKNLRLNNFEECKNILFDVFKHAYVAITAKLKGSENRLTRHILIAARSNVEDLIYAILVAFRCNGYHLKDLSTPAVTFLPITQDIESPYEDYAYSYPLTCLLQDNTVRVTYDYGDNFEFTIKFRKPVYLDDTKCKEESNAMVILQKANGYGIKEDEHSLLNDYFNNPDGQCYYEPTMTNKEALGFDFENSEFDELKESINELTHSMRFQHYEEIYMQSYEESFDYDDDEFEDLEDYESDTDDDTNNGVIEA